MNQHHIQPTIHQQPLIIRMLQAAAINVVIATLFLVLAPTPNHGIMILAPLVSVSAGGIFSGALFYMLDGVRSRGGWQAVLANFICGVAFVFFLWISSIPGLAAIGLWD